MAEKKKIALCLEYPLALRGGVSVLVETLIEGVRDAYEVILVSPDSPADLPPYFLNRHVFWNPDTVSPATSRALAEKLKQLGVALVHFHLGGNYGWGNRFVGHCPIPYLDLLGVVTCSTIHLVVSPLNGYCGPQKPLWFKLAMYPMAWLGKMHQLAHVQREITVSKHDASKVRKWYFPFRRKIVQLYHSRLFAEAHEPPAPARGKSILNVGHIAWRKGQLFLAEAFVRVAARHPGWKLELAGSILEPMIAEKIQELARSHNLSDRIVLLGERTDALQLMRRAGIYVQPSYYEALGLALQEAQFTGCPGIGTRVGGIPELIEHEKTGLLVNAGDLAQLSYALDALMSDENLREKLGRNGAASIIEKGMTRDKMVAHHLELYKTILNVAKPVPGQSP